MPIDPNWLLSSVAQSSAAMVAIIGGHLVSRLITHSVETLANRAQLEDLQGRRDALSASYHAIHGDRLNYSKAAFLEYSVEPTLHAKVKSPPTTCSPISPQSVALKAN